jgi:amino acid transporter
MVVKASERLRLDSVPFVGVLGQAVGDVGVTPSVAISIGLIAVISGAGNWLSWALTLPIFFAAAYAFSTMARRYATTGGLPSLIARATSSSYGFVVNILVLLWALVYLPFGDVFFAVYFRNLLNLFSVHGNTWIVVLAGLLVTAGASYVSYRGVRLAAAVLVVVELASSLLILLLMVVILVKHKGGIVDHQQLTLHGTNEHAIVLGTVFACLTFVSFECSTTFGQEASHAKRNIPLSLYGVLAYGGLLLVFTSYVMTLGFEGNGKDTLAASDNPLMDLTSIYHIHWLSYPLETLLVIAIWGVSLAIINWTARMLFTFGRERMFHRSLAVSDPRHKTPRNAVILIMVITIVIFYLMQALGRVNLTQFGYIGSSVTLFYLVAYVVAGAVIFVLGARQRHGGLMVAAAITAGGFGYVTYNTLRPTPPYPQNIYDDVVLGVAGLVMVGAIALRALRPGWLSRFGSTVDPDSELADEVEFGFEDPEALASVTI